MVIGFGVTDRPVVVARFTVTGTETGAIADPMALTVIVADPFCPGSTTPAAVTVAMVGADEAKAISDPASGRCVPSLNKPVTASVADVCSRSSDTLVGTTDIDVSVGGMGTSSASGVLRLPSASMTTMLSV
jgi:hypothetical protein